MRSVSANCKRTRSVVKSYFSTISVRPSSANSVKRSQRASDNNLSAVLNQILIVTNKVKKMMQVESKFAEISTNAQTMRSINQKKALTSFKSKMESFSHINLEELDDLDYLNFNRQNFNPLKTLNPDDLNICNPNCHSMINECMKLNRNNSKLKEKNEKLEKHLNLQKRETKELIKKLEKEMKKSKHSNAKDSQFSLNTSNPLSENRLRASCHKSASTTKKELFSKDFQLYNKSKPQKEEKGIVYREDNKSDSLLIDIESSELGRVEGIGSLASKTYQSMNLSRDLENLLEICINEQDHKKKRVIRKQMQSIAQQIQSLELPK